MIYPVKIEHREYPNGNWEDWSDKLNTPPVINKRVESDLEGEAGIIVFDNAKMTFRYNSGELPYAVYSIDLSSKERYLKRVSYQYKGFFADPIEASTDTSDTIISDQGEELVGNYSTKQSVALFEGMDDFMQLSKPHSMPIKNVEVVDKLTALGILTANGARGNYSTLTRVQSVPYSSSGRLLDYESSGTGPFWTHKIFFVPEDYLNNSNHGDMTEVMYKAGDILVHPDDSALSETDRRKAIVTESVLETISQIIVNYGAGQITYNNVTYNKITLYSVFDGTVADAPFGRNLFSTWTISPPGFEPKSYNILSFNYYDKLYYGKAIFDETSQAFDGLKIIEALYNQQWGLPNPVSVTLKPSSLSFYLPLDYSDRLIFNNPFNTDPLSAIKMISNMVKSSSSSTIIGCYIYVDKNSNLVIQAKDSLASGGTRELLAIQSLKIGEQIRISGIN